MELSVLKYLIKDPRITQAKKIIESVIGTAERKYCKAMITGDNTLVIIVLDTAIYVTNLINVDCGKPIGFEYLQSSLLNEDECIMNINIIQIVEQTYILYNRIISNPNNILAYDKELRGNEEIERLLGLKSADGCNFFKLNGNNIGEIHYFPFFSGFPNLSKPDKIGLEVFKFDQNHFVNVMNIYKKKINRYVKVIYRVVNLGGKNYE